ncbi:hypothetical protein LJC55_03940 [Eubacteriales bacterium OttesenSCG-928-N14]|nr:hypothetical protein [Eubacteriales bacterium OttesenSCG-928-N14]
MNRAQSRQMQGYASTKKKIAVVALLLLLAVASLAITGYFAGWYDGKDNGPVVSGDLFPGQGEQGDAGHLPGMSEEQIKEQMQKEADESKFSFKINTQPVFEDGKSAGTLRIENPNHNKYPFVVQITLDSNGKTVYNSGGLLPNYHINTAKLQEELAQGTYDATATIQVFDPDTKQFLGKSQVKLSIIVKN